MAWVTLSPVGCSSGLLARFLFGLSTAFTGAVPMKVAGFEILEFAEFIEGDIIDRPHMLSDGLVEFEDLPMGTGM